MNARVQLLGDTRPSPESLTEFDITINGRNILIVDIIFSTANREWKKKNRHVEYIREAKTQFNRTDESFV